MFEARFVFLAPRWLAPLIFFAFCFAMGSSAHAQAEESPIARRLRTEALEAARGGNWTQAADLYEQSYELSPRVLTLYNLAAAQMNAGQLMAADENFRRFLRETESGEHSEFRAEAVRSRESLERRIPQVRTRIVAGTPQDRLVLDEVSLPVSAVDSSLPIEPGEHRIEVRRGSTVVARRTFAVEEGARLVLDLTPVSDPSGLASAGSEDSLPGATPAPASQEDNRSVVEKPEFWAVTLAVVAVLAGAGVATYFLLEENQPRPYGATLGVIDFR